MVNELVLCLHPDDLDLFFRKDATLKELSGLIKEVHEDSRRREAKFSFRLVYQDGLRGRMLSKELGTVSNARPSRDDTRTLEDIRFIQGDYIDVAIYLGSSGPISAPISPPAYTGAQRNNGGVRKRSNDNSRKY